MIEALQGNPLAPALVSGHAGLFLVGVERETDACMALLYSTNTVWYCRYEESTDADADTMMAVRGEGREERAPFTHHLPQGWFV